jgi:hypothetical protein
MGYDSPNPYSPNPFLIAGKIEIWMNLRRNIQIITAAACSITVR